LRPTKYVAIKICTSNLAKEEDIEYELDMNFHIFSANSEHRGRVIIATPIDNFYLDSPAGSTHLSLALEPMREPLWLLGRRLTGEDSLIVFCSL
jgi:serine/threonine-protein kinase SRPK3